MDNINDSAFGFHTNRFADNFQRDIHLKRLVHCDFIEIRMQQPMRYRFQLKFFNQAVHPFLTRYIQSENRIFTRLRMKNTKDFLWIDFERDRFSFVSVQYSRYFSRLSQSPVWPFSADVPDISTDINLFHNLRSAKISTDVKQIVRLPTILYECW